METSPLICIVNQCTGFYVIRTRHERTNKHVFICLVHYSVKTKHGIMVVESVLTILKLDKL